MGKYIPELLAPAGGLTQLRAAVENGADAVYLGGRLMNARINADNFTREQLREGIAYAHLRDVKVHVTLNTLIGSQEVSEALEYGWELYELGADALIVQDFGLASLLRRELPSDMEIHLSTQCTIYNPSGVKMAEELGFNRVVLARETSLAEIRKIREESSVPLEVFVHGALCICYSGQCQYSRFVGGRSGNKGMCAQPCRLAFDRGFILSPRDLCLVDSLSELAEAGVSSLKIEGRMKSPEYVAVVTSIYRKYLDMYREMGSYEVSQEDRIKLRQIYSRGEFTEGYIHGNPGKGLMSGTVSKHQGMELGRVVGRVNHNLVEISPLADRKNPGLKVGDGVEIPGREPVGNIVTYIRPEGKNLVIGDLKGQVKPGSPVYKTSSKALLEEALETFDSKSSQGRKGYRRSPVFWRFFAAAGKLPKLVAENGEFRAEVYGESQLVVAERRPLDSETVRKQLSKVGDLPFEAEGFDIQLEGGPAMAVSELNALRRQALSLLAEAKGAGRGHSGQLASGKSPAGPKAQAPGVFRAVREAPASPENRRLVQIYVENLQGEKTEKEALEGAEAARGAGASVELILPLVQGFSGQCQDTVRKLGAAADFLSYHLPAVTKGGCDSFVEENLPQLQQRLKNEGSILHLNNLGWIREFRKAGVKLAADYGLNLYNNLDLAWAEDMGFSEFYPSLEIFESRSSDYRKWPVRYAGRVPLMVSEHHFGISSYIDRKGVEFKVKTGIFGDKDIIFRDTGRIKSLVMGELGKLEEGQWILRIYL